MGEVAMHTAVFTIEYQQAISHIENDLDGSFV